MTTPTHTRQIHLASRPHGWPTEDNFRLVETELPGPADGEVVVANPDLAERWRAGAELNEPNPATFYGGGAEGYTDYPSMAGASS